MMTNMKLKYPNMREELIGYFRELSDIQYQENNWLPENSINGVPSSQFDYSVHFLFDDTTLFSDPRRCIGWFLLNDNEVEAVRLVTDSIDQIFKKYGTELSDAQYIRTPEWKSVLNASKIALNIFDAN